MNWYVLLKYNSLAIHNCCRVQNYIKVGAAKIQFVSNSQHENGSPFEFASAAKIQFVSNSQHMDIWCDTRIGAAKIQFVSNSQLLL